MDKLLHIYGQDYWHCPVLIVGQKNALEKLRDAIDHALQEDHGTCTACANDGEGYDVHVVMENSNWGDSVWTTMQVPYTDSCAQQTDGEPPWELLKGKGVFQDG